MQIARWRFSICNSAMALANGYNTELMYVALIATIWQSTRCVLIIK